MRSRVTGFAVFVVAVAAVQWGAGDSGRKPILASSAVAVERANLKYMGAGSCSTDKCHGGTEKKKNEYTVFMAKDKHAKSYTILSDKKSVKIAKAMGIENAETSNRCLTCHSTQVPEAQQGKKFDITDGNTCEQCHGPSEKWLEPHAEKGWTKQKSIDLGALDTKDMYVRADTCIPCHVGIDHDMIEAGHPYPAFELDTYQATEPPHWEDEGAWKGVKAWAVGQAVALRDALKWVAKRAKEKAPDKYVETAYNEAHGRFLAIRPAIKDLAADSLGDLESGIKSLGEAVAAKDAGKLAAAEGLAGKADAVAKKLNGVEFDKDKSTAILKAIPGAASEVKSLQAAEQLTLSIDTLTKDMAKGGVKFAAAEAAVNKLFDELPEDASKFDAAAYGKALEGVGAALK